MHTLEYLRAGNSPESLKEKFAIDMKVHQDYPNLFLLSYNMIESDAANPIVQECRGLILDRDNDYAVVSRGYNRFFNHGEGHAAPIDWGTARVYEKADGSYAALYEYDGRWHVQTRGTPDASGEVQGFGFSFKELFWRTWDELGYELPREGTHNSYLFELCTRFNKILVRHPVSRIILHGIRSVCEADCCNLREYSVEEFGKFYVTRKNWEVIKSYPMSSFEEIVAACAAINPMDQEGYVVCGTVLDQYGNFPRVKVKSPQYVALNSLRDGYGPKRLMEIVRTNDHEEFLTYFPEWVDDFNKCRDKYNTLVHQLETLYQDNKHIEDAKQFALKVKDHPFCGAIFAVRRKTHNSIKEYLADINVRNLVEYFEKN